MLDSAKLAPLIQQLLSLEQELNAALVDAPHAPADTHPAAATLLELKNLIDRVRPLLWIHLNRGAE